MKLAISLSLLYCLTILYLNAQSTFLITGKLKNAEGQKVFLHYNGGLLKTGDEHFIFDTTVIRDGKFKFTGKVSHPEFYNIYVEGKRGWRYFILENKSYTIKGNADSIWATKIQGSQELAIQSEWAKMVNPIIKEMNKTSDSSLHYFHAGNTELEQKYTASHQFYAGQKKC